MSGLAVFSLKYPSLLYFDQNRNEEQASHNLRALYGIQKAPSDTYMREQLDEVDPKELRGAFLSIFEEARKGKLLEQYKFMDGYLVLTDGTQIFGSDSVHCENCCQKKHQDGRVSYYHQTLGAVVAHPERSQVIPLCPEPITKADGAKKNDCERNAMRRFLEDLKREHPRLRCTIASDALASNAPQINEILSYGYDFIINVKPEGNKTLFEWIQGLELNQTVTKMEKNTYSFRYINEIPLNNTPNAPEVNFFECKSVEYHGKRKIEKTFTWVTSHKITEKNIYLLMQGGRARWKIENETFNTLKNQGYQFEHNFGHGKKNLHTVFSFLMMLAFLVDQIQEAACGLFQSAVKHMKTRKRFWDRVRSVFDICYVNSWVEMWSALGPKFKPPSILLDSS